LLETENESLGVLAITGCGTRDLIFYTRNPEQARQKIDLAQKLISSHKIDAAIQPDKDWELYKFFNNAIAASPASGIKN